MIKKIIKFFLYFIFILTLLAIYLNIFGIKTNKLNNRINNEILKINAKGDKIESLEQYATYETSTDVNFENVVGQDSLTRFDKKNNRYKNKKKKVWKKA